MSFEAQKNAHDIMIEKLSLIDINKDLNVICQSFCEELMEKNKMEDHIKFIIKAGYNTFDVLNAPNAPVNEFLAEGEMDELKTLNERFIKVKTELDEHVEKLKLKYDNDALKLDGNDEETKEFLEKFGQKCLDLRRDHALHTIKIIYNFFKKNQIELKS